MDCYVSKARKNALMLMPDIKCGELCVFQSTVDLVITVRDNNDEYPVFSVDLAGGFTFSVKEVSIFV